MAAGCSGSSDVGSPRAKAGDAPGPWRPGGRRAPAVTAAAAALASRKRVGGLGFTAIEPRTAAAGLRDPVVACPARRSPGPHIPVAFRHPYRAAAALGDTGFGSEDSHRAEATLGGESQRAEHLLDRQRRPSQDLRG